MADETKPKEVKRKKGNAYVTSEFHDIADFSKKYEVGHDVTEFSEARIATLKDKGLVEIHGDEPVVDPPKA